MLTEADPEFPKKKGAGKIRDARTMLVDDYPTKASHSFKAPISGYHYADVNVQYLKHVIVPETGVERRP